MTKPKIALLPDRGVVQITGDDSLEFLQGLLTNDIAKASAGEAIFAGLLSPQGKVLFDFFAYNSGGGYLLDCSSELAPDIIKRLSLYKLRSKVALEDVSARFHVAALWGEADAGALTGAAAFRDPRYTRLGWRVLVPKGDLESLSHRIEAEAATASDYRARRIQLAIPEGGADYAYGDAFPHEACLDQLHGVDFKKGCYVGQEIVSRMEHRGTARRRVVAVAGDRLTPGAEIMAGDAALGRIGSVAGERGVAIVRIDRAGEAIAAGAEITADGAPVTLAIPSWANYVFAAPQPHDAH